MQKRKKFISLMLNFLILTIAVAGMILTTSKISFLLGSILVGFTSYNLGKDLDSYQKT